MYDGVALHRSGGRAMRERRCCPAMSKKAESPTRWLTLRTHNETERRDETTAPLLNDDKHPRVSNSVAAQCVKRFASAQSLSQRLRAACLSPYRTLYLVRSDRRADSNRTEWCSDFPQHSRSSPILVEKLHELCVFVSSFYSAPLDRDQIAPAFHYIGEDTPSRRDTLTLRGRAIVRVSLLGWTVLSQSPPCHPCLLGPFRVQKRLCRRRSRRPRLQRGAHARPVVITNDAD
jgi:hypothetical protein